MEVFYESQLFYNYLKILVDGRYTIQAQQESSDNYKIIEIHKKLPNEIIKNLNLGYDPSLFTKNILKKYFSNNNLTAINHNLIDQIFKFKKIKTKPFFSLDKSVVGESHHSKISKVVKFIKSNNADYLFVSAPENVAWLLNIRGYDSPSSPIPNARFIISKNKKIYLITKKSNAKTIIKERKINAKYIIDENNLSNLFYQLEEGNFIIDNKAYEK